MRVTNGMIASRVVYNMQRSLRRFMDMETNMSSGRRINRPSDDPTGTVRDLTYRTELAAIAQYRRNVDQGLNWMGTYDSTLSDLKDFVSSAKEVAVAMANGNYDEIARTASAAEIQSVFDQMLQIGNSTLEGRHIFAGFRTKTKPLETASNGVVYSGDDGRIRFEVEAGLKMPINFTGAEIFLKTLRDLGSEADLDIAVTGDVLLADLNNGAGIDLTAAPSLTITDRNLNISSTIDLSGAVTVQDVIDTVNAALAADGITNLTLGLGQEGNNLTFTTTQTGQISTATRLGVLNSGLGVDMNPGVIRVTDGAAVDVSIDLSAPVSVAEVLSVGDVITEFNAQLAAAGVNNVTLAVNAAGTALEVTDSNGPPPLGLTIVNDSEIDQTASDLGIDGNVADLLTGRDLNPVVSFEVAETAGTTAADLGLLGAFNHDHPGADIDPTLTVSSRLASFRHGLGVDQGEFVIWQGPSSLNIDLGDPTLVTVGDLLDRINISGLDLTASINASGRGIQIVNDDSDQSLMVEEVGDGRAAKDMGLFGAADMMGSVLLLANTLNRNDQEGAGILLQNLDDAIQHLLRYRGLVGSQTIRLETTAGRLTNQDFNFTELLSEVEDADMTELVTQLATQETSYQASLMASSKIIQPSLLDFLR
jgi:flagellar hook-associated protein 3 FlgL